MIGGDEVKVKLTVSIDITDPSTLDLSINKECDQPPPPEKPSPCKIQEPPEPSLITWPPLRKPQNPVPTK